MSTRANIVIRDAFGEELIFYRHSDGYPDGTLPSLRKFTDLVESGNIRRNVGQAAGWLILIGADEYGTSLQSCGKDKVMGWKVGAYEPTYELHGDIEYLYMIDLKTARIEYTEVCNEEGLEELRGRFK